MSDTPRIPAPTYVHRLTRRHFLTGATTAGVLALAGGSLSRPDAIAASDATTLDQIRTRLPKTADLLTSLSTRGGGQLYISLNGDVLANYAFGTIPSGAAITPDSLVPWGSAVKPSTCVTLMRLVERGRVNIEEFVTAYIAEFGQASKGATKVRHLLTHTGHLSGYNGPVGLISYDDTVAKIITAPFDPPDAVPGTNTGYNPPGIWMVGEILHRLLGVPFDQLIRNEFFLPMGMVDSWDGMSQSQFMAYGDRIVNGVGRIVAPQTTLAQCSLANPAGGGVGPMRELARVYEMMLAGGTIGGTQIISPATVQQMLTVQVTDGGIWTWGLGFNLNLYGPYNGGSATGSGGDPTSQSNRYGVYVTPQAFGHPGATGTIAFADPAHGIVIAMIGLNTTVSDAVYEDLNFLKPNTTPAPRTGAPTAAGGRAGQTTRRAGVTAAPLTPTPAPAPPRR